MPPMNARMFSAPFLTLSYENYFMISIDSVICCGFVAVLL